MLRSFKIQERELSYLTNEQINTLLSALKDARNQHVLLVAKVCLATGARWGEAEMLRGSQARNGIIQFVQTKSSKARAVPITIELQKELLAHFHKYGNGERLFTSAGSAFREGVERAGLKLPE